MSLSGSADSNWLDNFHFEEKRWRLKWNKVLNSFNICLSLYLMKLCALSLDLGSIPNGSTPIVPENRCFMFTIRSWNRWFKAVTGIRRWKLVVKTGSCEFITEGKCCCFVLERTRRRYSRWINLSNKSNFKTIMWNMFYWHMFDSYGPFDMVWYHTSLH